MVGLNYSYDMNYSLQLFWSMDSVDYLHPPETEDSPAPFGLLCVTLLLCSLS